MPKILLAYCKEAGGVIGYALCEDGECVASHFSSTEEWCKHDMGLSSDWKHDAYAAKYPDGYELEWVGNLSNNTHEGWEAAMKLNKERAEANGT